ncbi:MAG TPA: PspC domain-containing protein [Mucilaginibacter sp.]|nr:PspC domain-containing protein [Mucilaginibacter sp.]
MNKKLYRDEYHKVLGGVCSGLAEYFEMDVTIVRLLFAFTFFVMGVGLGTYIILWIVLPRKGYPYNPYNNPTVDYTVPPQQPKDGQTGNPFGGNPFGNNPFGGNPFAENAPPAAPFNPADIKPKQKSNAGLIVGMVLIFVGAAILVDEYDLIPDFDFDTYWPLILVIIGGALILSGRKREAWQKEDWRNGENAEDAKIDEPESSTDNNPTV